MSDLLLELYSEEMPATDLAMTAQKFHSILNNELLKNKIGVKKSEYFFTPTRLIFVFYQIKLISKNSKNLIRGPKVDSNEKALEGFARSNDVTVKDLVKKNTDKGEYYFFKGSSKKLRFEKILENSLSESLFKFSWKKSMKWGRQDIKWVRPLRNILCILNGKKIKIKFDTLMSNYFIFAREKNLIKKYKVLSVQEYFKILHRLNIKYKYDHRKKLILKEANSICKKRNLIFLPDHILLDEVTNLVDKPCLFLAEFKKDYLKLPKEVLTTSMQKNQKYFPLFYDNGKLSSSFLLVSNLKPKDKGKMIIEGNQRVINARLADADFFWKKDLKSDLSQQKIKLERLIFHNEIGTVLEKTIRLKFLVKFLGKDLKDLERKYLLNAAELCKNDLVSEMVREFPSLQGIMGKYYILHATGEEEVANAVLDHYKPLGPSEYIPKTLLSKLLALSDKLDSLVGFFIINKNPTGSKDPFALRRTALGIIRILIEGKISINLGDLLDQSLKAYMKSFHNNKLKNTIDYKTIKKQVLNFLLERYEHFVREDKQIDFIVFNSLIINRSELYLLNIHCRLKMLTNYINSKEGKLFLSSFKRVINFIEADQPKQKQIKKPVESLLQTREEIELYELVINNNIKDAEIEAFNFYNKLTIPIKNFFDNVTIKDKDENLEKNRVNLLSMINNRVNELTNFSIIIKGKENE